MQSILRVSWRFGLFLALASSCAPLNHAQLDAPTALSDFAGCRHNTCTWVPWSTHQSFRQGEFTYLVDNFRPDDTGGDFVLNRGKQSLLRTELKDLSASVSVVWSPDRRSFALTWSNGGAEGGFNVRVFRIQDDSVRELPSTQKAFDDFRSRHWCEARGDNLQAYRWSRDSRQLVLVLSVYPTSDCGRQMGHTEGYLVDATTGQIKENWSASRLKAFIRSHPEL